MSETTLQSTVRPPILSRGQNAHAAWAAAIAAIEVVAVAASAYGTVAAYSLLANKAVLGGVDYGWVSVAVAVLYSGICFADNQYDLMGPQWTEHRRSRGLAAVAVSFIFLLTIGFITETIEGYSRGLFLAQLTIALLVLFATRSTLLRVVDQARKRRNWRGAGIVMLSLPGANWTGHLQDGLLTPHEQIIRSYKLFSAIGESYSFLDEFDARILKISTRMQDVTGGRYPGCVRQG